METKVIVPTVGRKVWYWPGQEEIDNGFASDGKQPCDATICFVHSDRLVNISYADQCGHVYATTAVTLVQPGEPRVARMEGDCYCEWMPYQIANDEWPSEPAVAESRAARIEAAARKIVNTADVFQLLFKAPLYPEHLAGVVKLLREALEE